MAGTSSASCCYYNSRCSLPSALEPRVAGIRNQNAMQNLKVDGCRVRYVGPGEDDLQAATIRANYPVPADCPLYYFEVRVLDRGQEGFIGVGFCTEEVQLARLPGWDPHSYGYHGDDGHAFTGTGVGRPYGPPYTTGDVIGALYHKGDRTVSYFKNGEPLGVAFLEVQEASPLFPCVGLRTRGEEVVANFGAGASGEPFRTDFAALQNEFQRCVMRSVREVQLPLLSSRGTALLPQLLYDYLLHQRCWRTAAVLGRDLLRSEARRLDDDEAALADITVRQQVYDMVVGGRMDEALAVLGTKYPPELLTDRPSLGFRLRLQKFVEMVAAATAAAAAAAAGPSSTQPPSSTADVGQQRLQQQQQQPSVEPVAVGSGPHRQQNTGSSCEAASTAVAAAPDQAAEAGPAPMEEAGEGAREEARGSLGATGEPGAVAAVQAAGGGAAAGGSEASVCGGSGAAPPPTTRDILAYGTMELRPRCRTSSELDLLTDALSLLAFEDPAASPAGYLLRPAHRVALAEELNGSLLACHGLPATSPLERLYQQAAAVVAELKRLDHPQALALPDPRVLLSAPPCAPSPASGSAGPSGIAGDEGDPMTS